MVGDNVVTLVFDGTSKGLEAAASKSGSSLVTFGKVAGVAALAGGAALFKIGSDFDKMRDTIIEGTGASGKALDGMVNNAKNVATTVPASFADAGQAVADVNTTLGLTGKELEARSAQFLQLAKVAKLDVSSAITDVSRVFGDWGVATDKQAAAMDGLWYVSQATGAGVDDLSKKVVQFGAPMRQFGFSFEESVALMGKWQKEGVNTETVMGGLKAGLGKLSKAGKDPAQAFQEISAQIKNAGTVGEANAIAIETFGQRAGPDLAAAVREGRFEIADLVKGMKGSKGSIDSTEKATRSFSESWEMFKNKVLVKLEPLATKFFDALSIGMGWISENAIPIVVSFATFLGETLGAAIKNVTQFVKDNELWITALAAAVGALLIPLAAYQVYLGVLKLGTMAWTTATTIATAAQRALNLVMMANPAGLLIAGILAVVAAFVVLWNKSAAFRNFFIGIWNNIKDHFNGFIGWVKGAFNGLVGFFKSIPGKVGAALGGLASAAKNVFKGAVNGVVDALNWFLDHSINWLIRKVNDISGIIGVPAIPTIPHIPRMHTGGVVPGMPGEEVPIIARAGEKISPNGRNGGSTIRVAAGADKGVAELINYLIRKNYIQVV